jgi:hypothetical protein
MFFPALLAKFLSAGAVAQAASGAGIALVAFTGAGVVGVLPGPVQDSFSSVVGSETAAEDTTGPADQAPTGDTTGTGTDDGTAVDDPAVETPAPAAAEFDATGWADNGPSGTQTFSEWVSQGAHNKDALEAAAAARGVENFRFGQIVSEWAHKKHIDPSEVEGVEGADDTTTATPTPTAESETKSEDSGKTSHGSGGHGNSGSGNSGRGHN